MAFKFKDDLRMSGRGTLREYFSPETWAMPSSESDDPSLQAMIADTEDRNNAVDRLQLQLFTEFCGVDPDAEVNVLWPEDGYYDEDSYRKNKRRWRDARKRKGYNLIGWQMDDPIVCLFKDGAPLAAFYASYRGVYQAGGYVHLRYRNDPTLPADFQFEAAGTHHFAHNAFKESHAGPQDVWQEHESGCSDIARDMLLGLRKNY